MRWFRNFPAAWRAFWLVLKHGTHITVPPTDGRFAVYANGGQWVGDSIVDASRLIESARAKGQKWSYYVDGVERRRG